MLASDLLLNIIATKNNSKVIKTIEVHGLSPQGFRSLQMLTVNRALGSRESSVGSTLFNSGATHFSFLWILLRIVKRPLGFVLPLLLMECCSENFPFLSWCCFGISLWEQQAEAVLLFKHRFLLNSALILAQSSVFSVWCFIIAGAWGITGIFGEAEAMFAVVPVQLGWQILFGLQHLVWNSAAPQCVFKLISVHRQPGTGNTSLRVMKVQEMVNLWRDRRKYIWTV